MEETRREVIPLREVIILGGGPAGLSAAVYAARAERKPLVLRGPEPGGQAALTDHIENYPGFPEGIGGAELSDRIQKQAEAFGAELVFDSATEVDLGRYPFRVKTDSGIYDGKSLILAMGASPRKLGIPGEKIYTGKGVSYCATCDGRFFKEKNVVVVGGGDSALEEAIFLTRYVKSVTVMHRRNQFRAGKILQERTASNSKINVLFDTVIEEILGTDRVSDIRMKNLREGTIQSLPMDGVFIFVGHDPNVDILRGKVDLDSLGYVRVDQLMRTSVDGVFAAGEIADPVFRQVATSAGMGVSAAISAEKWLSNDEKRATK